MTVRPPGPRVTGRDANLLAVLERLALRPRSRVELARDLGVSPASVSRVVDVLRGADLVVEGDRVGGGVGRPQTLLQLHGGTALVVGVSVRSVRVRLRLATLDGTPLGQVAVVRDPAAPAALARQLRAEIVGLWQRHGRARPLAAVVVGVSAAWDARRRRVHAAPHLDAYEGVDLEAVLAEALADVVEGPVELENDVVLAAMGEHAVGAARGVDDFVYVSLGSGVRAAVVIEGRVRRGVAGFAGEIGYVPVPVADGVQRLEDVVGRAPLTRWAADRDDGDVFARLGAVDPVLTDHVVQHLAQGLVALVAAVDPALVVVATGVPDPDAAWTDRLRARLASLLPRTPDVVAAELGPDASLVGAVAHAVVLARAALVERRVASS